ncbi:hypothetical protein Cl131_gp105 [Aphanizomenon phage vB_AphaS-CL131]|nr:hypothetical protein Cl131_gp105 [Aphanizomenon phage vB_AphaS-CL131]
MFAIIRLRIPVSLDRGVSKPKSVEKMPALWVALITLKS